MSNIDTGGAAKYDEFAVGKPRREHTDHSLLLTCLIRGIIPIELARRSNMDELGCPVLSPVVREMMLNELAKAGATP